MKQHSAGYGPVGQETVEDFDTHEQAQVWLDTITIPDSPATVTVDDEGVESHSFEGAFHHKWIRLNDI